MSTDLPDDDYIRDGWTHLTAGGFYSHQAMATIIAVQWAMNPYAKVPGLGAIAVHVLSRLRDLFPHD